MRIKSPPRSRAALWRRRSDEVLASEVVASRNPGPAPPPEWAKVLRQLSDLSRAPVRAPVWWTPATAFFGNIETRTDPDSYRWDGMRRLGPRDPHLFFFQLTLAGWGHFQLYGKEPQRAVPGTGFFAIVPSRHRYYLPADSPGWTFGWIGVYHPYLLGRVAKQVAAVGSLVETPPDAALTAIALRLFRGAIKKDFRDRIEVEQTLFELVFGYERWALKTRRQSGEGDRLLDAVRSLIVTRLPKAIGVAAMAAEHGMTRSHFSHLFRLRTGLTPARFAAEVRIHEAARMLLDSRAPLKQIATACGFANPSHFCQSFRQFQHLSPAAYRHAMS
ncbi:MAG: AraC family transcriptional regulator [Polyangia bacterium]